METKIYQLLTSGQLDNVALAWELIQSQRIDTAPYIELVDWYFKNRTLFHEESFVEKLDILFGERTQLRSKMQKHSDVPSSIALLKNLKELYLYHNIITKLPSSIGELKELEILDLYCNRLKVLPESIGQLTQLKRLDLYQNELNYLPNSISQLTNLEVLNISSNFIKKLPEGLLALKKLKKVYLQNEKLDPSFVKHWKKQLADCQFY